MKEIGGYIELDEVDGQEYHSNAIALNSGRHCLEYLIKVKNIKKIYIPYYLCSSISNLCEKCNCEYEHYHIKENFELIFDKNLNDNEYLYIVNYYGQLTDEKKKEYKEKYKNVILDNSQAFFDRQIGDIDTIYTCRKFFGVSDGGYLYTNKYLNYELPIDKSYERVKYILGRYEVDAGTFFKDASQNNYNFRNEELKLMSKLTHNLLKRIDYNVIANKRTENFKFLHNELSSINKLNLSIPYGAFMYPLYIDNAKKIKEKLIENKIFVPTLWGDVFDIVEKNSVEYSLAENIIPLPVDQRYDKEDMQKIVEIINMEEKCKDD